MCVCESVSDVKPKAPQQEEASPPGSIQLMQGFSVRQSSWLTIPTKAEHSNPQGQANRGSFRRRTVCESVLLRSYQPLDQLFGW